MHDILEAQCPSCAFTLKGLPEDRAKAAGVCPLCGIALATRSNLCVTRLLPTGMGLLMGAFVASMDASPLLAPDHRRGTLGFARLQTNLSR